MHDYKMWTTLTNKLQQYRYFGFGKSKQTITAQSVALTELAVASYDPDPAKGVAKGSGALIWYISRLTGHEYSHTSATSLQTVVTHSKWPLEFKHKVKRLLELANEYKYGPVPPTKEQASAYLQMVKDVVGKLR